MFGPNWERTENEVKICKALEEVANQVGAKNIQAGQNSSVYYALINATCCLP